MIRDLETTNSTNISLESQFVIVGGGTAGLLLAKLLSDSGQSVIVLESGARDQLEDRHKLNEVVSLRSIYSGAEDGRFRCLGGTSTRWGGAMLPFLEADIGNFEWDFDYQSLLELIPELEKIFHSPSGGYEVENRYLDGANEYTLRSAKWPRFKYRNVARLFKAELENRENLQVWLNATVTQFRHSANQVHKIIAVSESGRSIDVKANEVILACGAIEVTRLLLQLQQDFTRENLKFADILGKNFSDHISAPIAHLNPQNINELNKHFGYQFAKSASMRNLRFELNDNSECRRTLPPHFVHISFTPPPNHAFALIRDYFRYVQRGKIPSLRLHLKIIEIDSLVGQSFLLEGIQEATLIP